MRDVWLDQSGRNDSDDSLDREDDTRPLVAPGRVTLTSRLAARRPIQAKTTAQLPARRPRAERTSGARELDLGLGQPRPSADAVQLRGDRGDASDPYVHDAAARGVAGFGGALPFRDQIARSFGPQHDVSGIHAHTDGAAGSAARAIGAQAYAVGDRVAFDGTPDLHTAAHEAAHVIQQRRGVSLKGGVGASGDVYERHADAVADAVVRGDSAAQLLDAGPGGAGGSFAVQRKGLIDIVGGGLSGANALLARSIALVMPGNLVAAQILGSVAIDDTLAALLNQWISSYITADLDQKVASLIDQGIRLMVSGGTAVIFPVIDGLDAVLAAWSKIPEPLQQVMMYIIGRCLQTVENFVVKLCVKLGVMAKRETNQDGEAINTHKIVTFFEPIAMVGDYAGWLKPVLVGVRTLLGNTPVTGAWQTFGGYLSRKIVDLGWVAASWFVTWVPRAEPSEDKPVPTELPSVKSKDDQLSLSQLAPPSPQPSGTTPTNTMMRKVNIGPMAIVPKKFGIVQSTKEKVGGLEVAAGLEFNFLDSGANIPTIDGAARIDWDGKFSWNVEVNDLTLLKKADLGFLSIDEIKLKKIQANDEFMELDLSAAGIKVGNFLQTGAVGLTWNSRTGLGLNLEDIVVKLPEPLAEVSGSLAMQIDRAGKLGLFELTRLKAGNFTIGRAAYTKDEFALENARYKLPGDLLGPDTWIGFGAKIGRTGQLLALAGEVGVGELYPLGEDDKSFRIGGIARVSYDDAGFALELADAHLAVETRYISGYAGISKATFRVGKKAKSFSITLDKLELRAGMVMASLTGARLDSQTKTLGATAGSLRFVGDNEKKVKEDLADLGMDNPAAWLKNLQFLSQLATATITNPRIEKRRLKWDSITLGPSDGKKHVNISLFGGMVRGMYDEESKTAKIGGHFAYPPNGASLVPPLAAEYHFVPGLGVFVELSIPGGFAADVDATVTKKEEGGFHIQGDVGLQAHLGVSLKGGVVAGSSYMAAARAYLEASATLQARSTAKLEANLTKDPNRALYSIQRPNDKFLSYTLSGDLIAQISLGVDLAALMMFSKRLVRFNLKTWKMGLFNIAGEVGEDKDGKLVHKLTRPTKETKKEDKDPTMGGAFKDPPHLDREALQPLPVDAAIELLEQKGEKFDDPRFANRLITDIEEAPLPAARKESLRKKVQKLFNTSEGKEKQTQEMFTGFEKEAKQFATARKLGSLGVTSRIMTLEQWTAYSEVRRIDSTEKTGSSKRGESIRKVDAVVAKYHAIVIPEVGSASVILGALKKRVAALAELKQACEEYMKGGKDFMSKMERKGRKQEMVKTLLEACAAEEDMLGPFVERAETIVTPKDEKQKKDD